MKRGFLNSTKAKKQHQFAGTTPNAQVITRKDKAPVPLPFGVIKETGPPKDYKSSKENLGVEEVDGKTQHHDKSQIFTCLPTRYQDEELEDSNGGWTEMFVSGYIKSLIVNTPGFPTPPKQPKRGPTYKIAMCPDNNKGLGMFATCDLAMGDLILDERPLAIFPVGVSHPNSGVKPHHTWAQQIQIRLFEAERLYEEVYRRMHPVNQKAYMALANAHQHDGSGPIMGICRTNGFQAGDLCEKEVNENCGRYSAICNDLSRMNHSCSPNTVRTFHIYSLSMEVRAARAIKEGEEITTHYCPYLDTAEHRQKSLAPYGIKCACKACSNPTISDVRRASIAIRSIVAPTFKQFGKSWIEPAIASLREMEEEGVEADVDSYRATLLQLVNAYVSLGNEDDAFRYGQKLIAAYRASCGNMKEVNFCRTREGIRSHPSWKTST